MARVQVVLDPPELEEDGLRLRSCCLTREQYRAFCHANPDLRIERLASGEVVIMPLTHSRSGAQNAALIAQLVLWARKYGRGVAFDNNTGFDLPDGSNRSPDAAWVSKSRIDALTPEQREEYLSLSPDFVIELRSRSDRLSSLKDKMQEYIDNGTRLGWLIDPIARQVHIFRPGAAVETLANPATLSGDPELPGFQLDLTPVWNPGRVAFFALLLAPLLCGQGNSTVEGVVVNRITGAGIGGVAVMLYTRQAIQYEATTDDSGRFRVTGMRPGSYQVRYEKLRLKPFHEDPAAPYAIEPGSGVRLRLEMTPLVTLRGRALTSDGKPALRSQVRMGTFFAFVDDRGEFVFDQLQPGSYTLLAEPGPSPPSAERIEPVLTYFPRRIVVRGDADLSGYEVRLQSVPVHRIRGVVRDEAGKPALAALRLLPVVQQERRALGDAGSDYFFVVGPEKGDGPLEASTTSSEDGSFEFPSVPSGDWRIAVDAPGRLGQAAISVRQSDLDDLQIRIDRAVPFAMNVAIDWSGEPAAGLLSALPGRKVIRPDGTVRLENVLPGRYRVLPLADRGRYPVSAVLGQIVGFDAGSPDLRIVYKTATGSVAGRAPAGSTVVLLPSAGYGRIARCDLSGAFSIDGVAPGDYFVSAFEWFDASLLTDPELLSKIAARGAKVTVGAGRAAGLDLTPIRWPE